jgi:hypothetical protein
VISALNFLTEVVNARRFGAGVARLRSKLERQAQRELDAEFRELGRHVARAARSRGGLYFDKPVEEAPYRALNRSLDLSTKETARVEAIVKAAKLDKWAERRIKPWIEKLYEGAFLGTHSLSQSALGDTERDRALKKVLTQGGRRLGLIDLTENTKSALFRVIEFSRNYETGVPSPTQIAKWIESEVPAGRFVNAGPRYRSQLIARTEVMHATRTSSIETFRADPSVKKLLAVDGDYDDDCSSRNGEEFTFADAETESLSDTVHPNCTLVFVPAMER